MALYRDRNPEKPKPSKTEQTRKAVMARLKGQGFALGVVAGYLLALVHDLIR